MADTFNGLQIVDVRDPLWPQKVSTYRQAPGRLLDAWRVTLNGPWAYVLNINAGLSPGLWIVHTLDPAHPTFWDYYEVPASAGAVTIDGSTVYLSSDGEVYILRINDHVMQPQSYLPTMLMSQG